MIRSLYLRIYLTVVLVLLVFALVAGVLVRSHAEAERGRIDAAINERGLAWASLLEQSLPAATEPDAVQGAAVQDWSRRLRLPLALDDAAGRRIVASAFYQRLLDQMGTDAQFALRVPLSDGRFLWIGRPRRQEGGPPHRPDAAGPASRADLKPWRFGPGRPVPPWLDDAGALLIVLSAVFVAVAAGSYPVVRRLTRRLEALQRGVETFGAGDLSHRVDAEGRDEVAVLAQSFNRAAQQVEDLVRSNRSLLANASHELRSPLARLKMAVEMLGLAAPEQRAALKAEIDRDIRELDALVEEVLLASRLDARTEIQAEPVDLVGLLAEEAARVDATLDAPGDLPLLHGDERLLRRAVRNLLENARRYGGDEVEAQLQRQGDRLEVRICDRGPGVPAGFEERVFEPFFRLPGHAEYAGGVGLGLSLVRQIVQRHGGEVRCQTREGGGSCFALSLPLA